MITRSRSFFYSVNLAVQKVKTRERTNTAINISQRGIIPVPQSTVLCRNTDLPYYHSFVAVTGVKGIGHRPSQPYNSLPMNYIEILLA